MTRLAHLGQRSFLMCAAMMAFATAAHARIGLVLGEPFGPFGTMLPVGHAGIYLDNVCAATPTHLRPCRPGETGVVLSRYHDLTDSHLDWMAIPAFTFFYGVATPGDVPAFVTPQIKNRLREAYREENLSGIVPQPVKLRTDRHGKQITPDNADWQEGIGAAFDRRVFLYTIATTPEQDRAILNYVNDLRNRRRYTLARANCADFAADLLRMVLPHENPPVLRRSILIDFDFTTPKSLARQLDAYASAHPELDPAVYEIPQLPGTVRRSRPVRTPAELFLTTKRYLFTLLVIQPEFVVADWIAYEAKGRWKPGRDAEIITPEQWPGAPASTTLETTVSEQDEF